MGPEESIQNQHYFRIGFLGHHDHLQSGGLVHHSDYSQRSFNVFILQTGVAAYFQQEKGEIGIFVIFWYQFNELLDLARHSIAANLLYSSDLRVIRKDRDHQHNSQNNQIPLFSRNSLHGLLLLGV